MNSKFKLLHRSTLRRMEIIPVYTQCFKFLFMPFNFVFVSRAVKAGKRALKSDHLLSTPVLQFNLSLEIKPCTTIFNGQEVYPKKLAPLHFL